MPIPKIINLIWLDRIEYDNSGPPSHHRSYHDNIAAWKSLNPDCKVKFWNRKKVDKLMEHPDLAKYKDFYHNLQYHIEKCDFARYAIMYVQGGLYADLDYIPNKPIGRILAKHDLIFVPEPKEHQGIYRGRLIWNGFFCSEPGHPIWAKIMDAIIERYDKQRGTAFWKTGPAKVSDVLRENQELVEGHIHNTCYYLPHYNGGIAKGCEQIEENKEYYGFTRWTQGTNWSSEYSSDMTAMIVLGVIVLLLILAAIAAVIFGIWMMGRR